MPRSGWFKRRNHLGDALSPDGWRNVGRKGPRREGRAGGARRAPCLAGRGQHPRWPTGSEHGGGWGRPTVQQHARGEGRVQAGGGVSCELPQNFLDAASTNRQIHCCVVLLALLSITTGWGVQPWRHPGFPGCIPCPGQTPPFQPSPSSPPTSDQPVGSRGTSVSPSAAPRLWSGRRGGGRQAEWGCWPCWGRPQTRPTVAVMIVCLGSCRAQPPGAVRGTIANFGSEQTAPSTAPPPLHLIVVHYSTKVTKLLSVPSKDSVTARLGAPSATTQQQQQQQQQ